MSSYRAWIVTCISHIQKKYTEEIYGDLNRKHAKSESLEKCQAIV